MPKRYLLYFLLGLFLILPFACSVKSRPFTKRATFPKKTSNYFMSRWLTANTFIDQEEITNVQYREFLHWLSRCDSSKHDEMLPDTNVWLKMKNPSRGMSKYYHSHPAYYEHPVVGVSMAQAEAFCKWRAARINVYIHYRITDTFSGNCNSIASIPEYVSCRLPTAEEWIYAAQGGLDTSRYRLGVKMLTDKKGKVIYNTKERYNLGRFDNSRLFWSEFYLPLKSAEDEQTNPYGLYHLLGNVSELTSDSLIMGLSFDTYLDGSPHFEVPYKLNSSIPYSEPKEWLGFRTVLDYHPENWPME